MDKAVLQRVKDFQKLLKNAHLDGYVCVDETELHYFMPLFEEGDSAILLITPRQIYAFTKALLVPKLQLMSFLKIQVITSDLLTSVLNFARQKKLLRLAFNPDAIDFRTGEKLVQAGLTRLEGGVLEMRKAKYADEIATITAACRLTAQALDEVHPQIKTGMTEEEVSRLLACAMVKRGASSAPFVIVSFGENCADCHHVPSNKRKLKKNDAVLIDFGCTYKGYYSDMTRSWWHGDKEPAEYTRIWHFVHMAKEAAAKQTQVGSPIAAIDKTARSIIEDGGYGEYFIHTTGHGVGLNIHEAPTVYKNTPGVLDENFVVTIEPGIYLPGKYGVRLEDTYLVTKKGAKSLTGKITAHRATNRGKL